MSCAAKISIDATSPIEGPFTIDLEIGTPYRCDTGEWACRLSLDGLYYGLPDIRGEDSLQALCLAVSTALTLLRDFRRDGGTLQIDGDEFPLEAYWFRPVETDD